MTVRTLDEKAVARNENGFTVKLPSGAPIPTPTIYDGKVYLSNLSPKIHSLGLKTKPGSFMIAKEVGPYRRGVFFAAFAGN